MAASRGVGTQSSSLSPLSGPVDEMNEAPTTNHLGLHRGPVQPSESSLEQNEPKPRWQDAPEANVWKLWWMELLAIVVSLACLGANVAFLTVLNDKEYKSWKIARVDFTPNTIISIIATFTKASLLLPIAEVLSQLKWLHFQGRIQQLSHLQIFDDASRGPLGSLRLLWNINRESSIASLAAIVTVLALALEPFTQQVIRYPTKQTPATNVTAIIGATNVFDPNAFKGVSNYTVLQANEVQQLNAAIDSAIIKEAPDTSYSCPSAQCDWPVFTSLGLCAAYQDIASLVDISCEDKGADVSKNSTYHLCNYTMSAAASMYYSGEPSFLAWNLWQTTGDGIYRPSTLMNVSQDFSQDSRSPMLDVIYFEESYNRTDSGAPDNIKPTMTRFRLDWCSKYYGLTTFYNGTLHDMPNFVVPLTYNGGDAQPDLSNLTLTEAQLFSETDSNYQIDDQLSTMFQKLLVSLLVTTVFAQDSNPDVLNEMLPPQYWADFVKLGPLEWNTAYSKGVAMYYANNNDMRKTFENIATSVTNQIRSSYASTNVTGTATYTIVYIEVVWPWLVFSIILTLLAAALLGVTMWISSRTDKFVWKSSSLAPIFHGLPDGEADGRFLRRATMDKAAGLMYARLGKDDDGSAKLNLL